MLTKLVSQWKDRRRGAQVAREALSSVLLQHRVVLSLPPSCFVVEWDTLGYVATWRDPSGGHDVMGWGVNIPDAIAACKLALIDVWDAHPPVSIQS